MDKIKSDSALIIDECSLKDKIYEIRGQKVMLDFELAELYGYTTGAFNQQVARNKDRFDEDFYFLLTPEEMRLLSLSQNVIAIQTTGIKGGRSKVHAFTEQGIYMLMTVLKGDLAVKQSKALIRMFKRMKDYIYQDSRVIEKIDNNSQLIEQILIEQRDIKAVVDGFSEKIQTEEQLLGRGKRFDADCVHSRIYKSAKKSIFIIDNYIGLRTLVLLKDISPKIKCTIFSNNSCGGLHKVEFEDFKKQYPSINVSLKKQFQKIHDRFIILDYGTEYEKIYHSGGSINDAGRRETVISKLNGTPELEKLFKKLVAKAALLKLK